jgi:hypothetical protein
LFRPHLPRLAYGLERRLTETGTAAACSKVRLPGLAASFSTGATAYSASVPAPLPNTSSPGANLVTPRSTASTTPASMAEDPSLGDRSRERA